MNIRPLAQRAFKSCPLVILAVLACSGSAAAVTPNSIEEVWSFSGGAVAIKAMPNGTFEGTVVSPTKFASCEHPVEQSMWTEMQEQADGSFHGLHFWYQGANCEEDPVRGLTAWRVLTNASGERTLKVCFSTPSSKTQPSIAPNGAPNGPSEYAAYGVTYGCSTSNPLAPLPETELPGSKGGLGGSNSGSGSIVFSKTVVLPPATACVSQTSLKISLKDPKYDPLSEVVVKLNGKKVADVKGVKTLKKGITLKKLPTGTYKVSVVATTVLKQRLSGSKTYKSCTKGSGKIKLKGSKTHHP